MLENDTYFVTMHQKVLVLTAQWWLILAERISGKKCLFPLKSNHSGNLTDIFLAWYHRREGYAGHFVAGRAPPLEEEPNVENLDVDYTYFDKTVYPALVNRVPGFKNLKVLHL